MHTVCAVVLWSCLAIFRHSAAAKETLIPDRVLSDHPVMVRVRGALSHEEADALKLALVDAIVFFNDSNPTTGWRRPGSTLPEQRGMPRYRLQSQGQVSFHFAQPTKEMHAMYHRLADMSQISVNNVEAIYHMYLPGYLPTNLHLDNFNSLLFPHRVSSFSVFFDDLPDGGTVFPLALVDGSVPDHIVANDAAVKKWHERLNLSRMDPGSAAYAYRRVEADETDAFRREVMEKALQMCRGGGAMQFPVVPEKGTAYYWRNYLANGEDDPRAIHAGCGASTEVKMMATLFLRDGPGPFDEHQAFWSPHEEVQDEINERFRAVEMQGLQVFRLMALRRLYTIQQDVAEANGGYEAQQAVAHRLYYHWESLVQDSVLDAVEAERRRQRMTYGYDDSMDIAF
eukprot:TRINITY_DN45090_c0_g1_i2.p2 TRINITY_DN45090_c0_g1~~TRINITY_DN45090_c0_g1_i2.p2  ORF type:complete len:398 (+),score=83.14 TRINITY_DN45090_c0_g1_i2:181-1374(+)